MTPAFFLDQMFEFFRLNGFIIEIVISVLLYTWTLKARPHRIWNGCLGVGLMVALSTLWGLYVPESLWASIAQNLLVFALVMVWILVCWQVNLRQVLFCFVLGGTTQHFAFRGATICSLVLARKVPWPGGKILYALFLIPFLAVAYWCYARPFANRSRVLPQRQSLFAILAGMLLCVSVFTNLLASIRPPVGPSITLVFSAFDLVCCLLMLSLCLELANKQVAQYEGEMLRQLLRQQGKQMAVSKETIDLINVKTHDLKKQINQMGRALTDGQVRDLTNLVDVYDATVRTGNDALDVLLAQKALICEQRGIRFDRMIDGSLLNFMTPTDVYALFGNALDNALEALAHLEKDGDAYIQVDVRKRRGMVVVRVENPYRGRLNFVGRLPTTTKGDNRYHGFGMQSMDMIVRQYQGHLFAKTLDDRFILTVVLPSDR